MLIRDWLDQTIVRFGESQSPKRDAQVILGWGINKLHSWIIAFDDKELTAEELHRLEILVARRIKGEPVAYLTGQREFWSLPLQVNRYTLIPRPDTEVLVEQALALLPARPCKVLDLGTGTGAIALALAKERCDCRITGVDCFPQVVALAKQNTIALKLVNCDIQLSHWFLSLSPACYDMITANPPYIDQQDPHLQQGDVRFEPKSALVAGDQGLADLRTIISDSRQWLTCKGWLLVEHGWQQAEPVCQMFTQAGYRNIETRHDYGGNPRVTYGQYYG